MVAYIERLPLPHLTQLDIRYSSNLGGFEWKKNDVRVDVHRPQRTLHSGICEHVRRDLTDDEDRERISLKHHSAPLVSFKSDSEVRVTMSKPINTLSSSTSDQSHGLQRRAAPNCLPHCHKKQCRTVVLRKKKRPEKRSYKGEPQVTDGPFSIKHDQTMFSRCFALFHFLCIHSFSPVSKKQRTVGTTQQLLTCTT